MTDTQDDTTGEQSDSGEMTEEQSDTRKTTGERPDRPSTADTRSTERETAEQMLYYGQWLAFCFLVFVALVASVRLYIAASASIDRFVVRRYQSLFVAGFNLAVVLGCGVGISLLVRRIAWD